MNNKGWMWVLIIVVILVIGGGAWYFWGNATSDPDGDGVPDTASGANSDMDNMDMGQSASSTDTNTTDNSASAGVDVNAGVEVTPGAVENVTVTGSNFTFAPKTITVKKGDTINLTFKNSGGTHDLVIDELGVRTKTIAGGASDMVTFVASKAGTFTYYCSVGNHRAMGMTGTITVTP
jgi:plastocyanin